MSIDAEGEVSVKTPHWEFWLDPRVDLGRNLAWISSKREPKFSGDQVERHLGSGHFQYLSFTLKITHSLVQNNFFHPSFFCLHWTPNSPSHFSIILALSLTHSLVESPNPTIIKSLLAAYPFCIPFHNREVATSRASVLALYVLHPSALFC